MTVETNLCQEPGVYNLAYPYDCKKFVQCVDGRSIVMPCAEGLIWDDDLQICNWPEQANCIEVPRP